MPGKVSLTISSAAKVLFFSLYNGMLESALGKARLRQVLSLIVFQSALTQFLFHRGKRGIGILAGSSGSLAHTEVP